MGKFTSPNKTHQVDAVGPGWEDYSSIGWILFWGTLHFETVPMNQLKHFKPSVYNSLKGDRPTHSSWKDNRVGISNTSSISWVSVGSEQLRVLVLGWKKWLYFPQLGGYVDEIASFPPNWLWSKWESCLKKGVNIRKNWNNLVLSESTITKVTKETNQSSTPNMVVETPCQPSFQSH